MNVLHFIYPFLSLYVYYLAPMSNVEYKYEYG